MAGATRTQRLNNHWILDLWISNCCSNARGSNNSQVFKDWKTIEFRPQSLNFILVFLFGFYLICFGFRTHSRNHPCYPESWRNVRGRHHMLDRFCWQTSIARIVRSLLWWVYDKIIAGSNASRFSQRFLYMQPAHWLHTLCRNNTGDP